MEVAGDPDDFMPVFSSLDKKGEIYKDIDKAIKGLNKDKIIGTYIHRNKIPKYYIQKHDYNAHFKVVLPENWRLIYGIISINRQKKALLMEAFDHRVIMRFGFKKR